MGTKLAFYTKYCRRCDKKFLSSGKFARICDDCYKINSKKIKKEK